MFKGELLCNHREDRHWCTWQRTDILRFIQCSNVEVLGHLCEHPKICLMLHVLRCLPDYHLLLGPVHSPRIPGTVHPPHIPGTVCPPRTMHPLLHCPVHLNQCHQWTQSKVPTCKLNCALPVTMAPFSSHACNLMEKSFWQAVCVHYSVSRCCSITALFRRRQQATVVEDNLRKTLTNYQWGIPWCHSICMLGRHQWRYQGRVCLWMCKWYHPCIQVGWCCSTYISNGSDKNWLIVLGMICVCVHGRCTQWAHCRRPQIQFTVQMHCKHRQWCTIHLVFGWPWCALSSLIPSSALISVINGTRWPYIHGWRASSRTLHWEFHLFLWQWSQCCTNLSWIAQDVRATLQRQCIYCRLFLFSC